MMRKKASQRRSMAALSFWLDDSSVKPVRATITDVVCRNETPDGRIMLLPGPRVCVSGMPEDLRLASWVIQVSHGATFPPCNASAAAQWEIVREVR